MRRANVVSGVVLSVVGLVMLIAVIPAQIEQGPDGIVSPRLMPNLMMIAVTALSALLVAANLRRAEPGGEEGSAGEAETSPIAPGEIAALLKFAALFAVVVTLFVQVSPLAAGAALVIGALLLLGERRPLVLVLMPASLLLALWLLFYKVLGTAIV